MITLTVWGGRWIDENHKYTRAVVAAYTKKQAMELAGISYREITDYWSETGNKTELETANVPGLWVWNKEVGKSAFLIRKK
jgi:hypothetical protein